MGDLAHLGALLVGRPGGEIPVGQHAAYDEAILQTVVGEAGRGDLPVVAGMDFGHTDPMWTLPQGVPVRVDPRRQEVTFLDAGVR